MTGDHRLRRHGAALAALSLLLVGTATPANAVEQAFSVERVENIKHAAASIAELQIQKGAPAAIAAISDCYDKELETASTVTLGLEACMSQDIAVSRMASAVDSRLSPEERAKEGADDPQKRLDAMAERIANIYKQFGMPDDAMKQFVRTVNAYGMESYKDTILREMPGAEESVEGSAQ
ncbi:hypothetical protein A7A08_00812 [Methyloligella halotolerans]|uniref:DUF4168 domain-containing protein n=1 Tax=Methyloligella halotolerans TaxID=1177755 RepID=A0A1E2S394_9HYPH|nr:hypothetical protein [Methyloligella halotolerans]ODA68977.1 hypothetical protein A7A08_00812 [Methyloligella halotolerans]